MNGKLNMSTNTPFLLACIFLLNIPGFLIDYAQSYQNQLNPCFEVKYDWADGNDTDVHIAILGSSCILGMMLGAITGGVLMSIGRRRSMFICLTIGLVGNLLSINLSSFWMVIVGRVLFGYAVGIY